MKVRAFPETIVQKVPKLKGYSFFTAENRLAIVDQRGSKVQLVLERHARNRTVDERPPNRFSIQCVHGVGLLQDGLRSCLLTRSVAEWRAHRSGDNSERRCQ